ncbi:MAG: IS21 family transposase [Flavobacteriales bacterium]|nr:IS21 family transposase [Flavobacteriales bacterium]
MITDQQYRRLVKMKEGKPLCESADKAGMSEKTARKYLKKKRLPSEMKEAHTWKTHSDEFSEIWPLIKGMLELNSGLEATTLLPYMQREYPGEYEDRQLRTLQRRLKHWRATEGPSKEVMFAQDHHPGELSQSDFTHMDEVGVTIGGELFKHMVYHFVLTYSNWEHATICFSESFESFSEGFQESLWTLGGVPVSHQTDQMSLAIQKAESKKVFTQRYQSLLDHYTLKGRKIQVQKPNENGDVEQSHNRFKRALKQALMLRGSSAFESRLDYSHFLTQLLAQLNSGRNIKFEEEKKHLQTLPLTHLNTVRELKVSVRSGSTIAVDRNNYSVNSRLIGEKVDVKIYAERIEVWFCQKKQDDFSRLIGRGKSQINYRHIIDSLVRKPGAFANYRYRDELFPSSRFRVAYDSLCKNNPSKSSAEYLKLLHLAAQVSETKVDQAITWLMDQNLPIEYDFVQDLVNHADDLPTVHHINIPDPDIQVYDELLMVAS